MIQIDKTIFVVKYLKFQSYHKLS